MAVQSLGWEDPLEEDMTTHSSILAWRIPWTEELCGLQFRVTKSQTRLKQFHTHSDSILKSRNITLLTKVCIVKAMVFPVVVYRYENWTIKKIECWRIDAFKLWF